MPRGVRKQVAAPNIEIKETVNEEVQVESTTVETQEQSKRTDVVVMEKAKNPEKDLAPVIIFSYTDSTGRRQSKTFTCSTATLQTYMSEQFQKSGTKTKLTLSIEAEVLERS